MLRLSKRFSLVYVIKFTWLHNNSQFFFEQSVEFFDPVHLRWNIYLFLLHIHLYFVLSNNISSITYSGIKPVYMHWNKFVIPSINIVIRKIILTIVKIYYLNWIKLIIIYMFLRKRFLFVIACFSSCTGTFSLNHLKHLTFVYSVV